MKKYTYLKWAFLGIAAAIIMVGTSNDALACTLWAAAGESVVNGGTLIAKNRDWDPDEIQQIRFVKPDNGLRFIGLYATKYREARIKAGVNEAGLVVVNAAVLKKSPFYQAHAFDLITRLLSQCKNIGDVLRHEDWFFGSWYLLLADHKEIAMLEIGPYGMYKAKRSNSKTLCHTNHYIEPGFRIFNRYPLDESSRSRLSFIEKYLGAGRKFSLDDFVKISYSQQNGPDNSLWRKGDSPDSVRTLATWIVSQPATGKPVLFVRLANLNQHIKEYYFDLQKSFKDNTLISEAKPHRFFIF